MAIITTIQAAFHKYSTEAAIIGRLLGGYTVLEVALLNAVQVIRNDFDTTLKVMFRTRGETQRLDVADAMGRHFYKNQKLETEFSMAIGAAQYCLKIRNQYSHCIWWDDLSGKLAFANMEEIAKHNEYVADLGDLTTLYVDVPLLEQQEHYFAHANDLLNWVNFEGRQRAGTISNHAYSKPKQMKRPPLQLPQ